MTAGELVATNPMEGKSPFELRIDQACGVVFSDQQSMTLRIPRFYVTNDTHSGAINSLNYKLEGVEPPCRDLVERTCAQFRAEGLKAF